MPDFTAIHPNSQLVVDASPLPPEDDFDFRGILLTGPAKHTLTAPGPADPTGTSDLRLVVCATITASLLDERNFAKDGNGDLVGSLTFVVANPKAGQAWAGRMPLKPVRSRRDDMAGISDAEAAQTVVTRYLNPNLPDVVPMPNAAGTYHVHAVLGHWISNPITIHVALPG